MRVLLIIDWNRGSGGAESHALYLREGLRVAGDEVRLLTSSAGTAGDGTADYVAYGTENRAAQAFLQIANPGAATTVRRAVKEFRPDVIWINMFLHHLSPAVILAAGNVPKVLLVSDYKLVCPIGSKLLPDGSLCGDGAGRICVRNGCVSWPHWLRDRPRYALVRSALKRTDRIIACSRAVQRELTIADLPADVMHLPSPPRPRDFVRQPASDPLFFYFGRLDVEKGVDLLIRAFARLSREFPTARLVVAGRGPERAGLENLATTLGAGGAVEFSEWLSRSELEQPLSQAWASVVPSVWAEPLGLVAAESVLRGVPVIASSAGGLGEIVEDGADGLLFPNNDEEALLNCLQAVASGAAFPHHVLSAAAVEGAEEAFGMDRYIRELRQLFAEIAQAATRPQR